VPDGAAHAEGPDVGSAPDAGLDPDADHPDGAPAPCSAPDRCDGLDTDCDGRRDEDFATVGDACEGGVWVCDAPQERLVCGQGDLFAPPPCPEVTLTPPPAGLSPFYTRHVDLGGVPLLGSDGVPLEAFRVAVWLADALFAQRPCLREALARSGVRVGVMARDEVTTDMPEYSDFNEAFPGTDWDARGRGFGATLERPLTSTAVESLLKDPSDPLLGELILLHELAHSIFEFGVEDTPEGPGMRARLEALYADAMRERRWDATYAATNANEYWAEGVQSWLDDNLASDPADGVHGPIDTRAELEVADPGLAALIAEVLDAERWPTWCDPSRAGPPRAPPPPAVGCRWRVGVVRPDPCAATGASVAGGAPGPVTFVNRRLTPVRIDWLDPSGRAVSYGEIAPRSRLELSSYAGHVWRFADGQTCIGVAALPEGESRVLIE
jgi:hypothetical protein